MVDDLAAQSYALGGIRSLFDSLGTDEAPVSKSALVQARCKLLPKFFEDMFTQSHKALYTAFAAKRWKGFRLWATDGTGFRLPNETWLGNVFGWHENQHNKAHGLRPWIRRPYHPLFAPILRLQLPDPNPGRVQQYGQSLCQKR